MSEKQGVLTEICGWPPVAKYGGWLRAGGRSRVLRGDVESDIGLRADPASLDGVEEKVGGIWDGMETPASKRSLPAARRFMLPTRQRWHNFMRPALMQRLLSDPALTRSTYYFSYYQLEALREAGLGDCYVEQLGPWRRMLDLGLTTVPETEPTRSDSHAWSAHPNYGLLATLDGVLV
jgi:hypothetical protein